jgi:large subunit ribosomal protein L22
LVVVDARIDGGPMVKRFQPRSRGQAFTILKRTSHISVVLKRLDEL